MAKKNRIEITVKGGVLCDVFIPENLNVEVLVIDFDIEGIDEDRFSYNDDGEPYIEMLWA